MFLKFTQRLIGLLILISLFYSCQKDKDQELAPTYYLNNHELIESYNKDYVAFKLVLLSLFDDAFSTVLTSVNSGVNIYRIEYQTEFQNKDIMASGLVCVPDINGEYPIISFQNGTNTCKSNTPSENIYDSLYSIIIAAAGAGYIVAIPDYLGFGEAGHMLHPYLHRESSDRAILNMLEATKEFLVQPSINYSTNNELFLLGYSQGAWATISVLDELKNNDIELNVIAASAGAGIYDLIGMSEYVLSQETYPNPFYLPYYIHSRIENNLLVDSLSGYFNSPYAENIPELFEGSICNQELNAQLPQGIDSLVIIDFKENFKTSPKYLNLRRDLSENSIIPWNIEADLLLFHSTGDESIPSDFSKSVYDKFIKTGASEKRVTYVEIENSTHNEAILEWGVQSLIWLEKFR